MPAVDPVRLAREVDGVFGLALEPSALAGKIRDLLERYAERARRKGGKPEDSLDCPRPVMVALAHAIGAEARRGGRGLELADALWSTPIRETRLLACEALGVEPGDAPAAWAERRGSETSDLRVLEGLARRGLAAWGSRDRPAALGRVERWIRSKGERLRELGCLFLLPVAEGGESEDVRQVIDLLHHSPEVGLGVERRTLSTLLLILVRRSPQEATRYLLDAVAEGNPAVTQIARQALPLLPPRQKRDLEETLARARASGRMPASND
jgi:hypothetical protein